MEIYKVYNNKPNFKSREVFDKLCKNNSSYIIRSASVGSFLALDYFLKKKNPIEMEAFFKRVAKRLFSDVIENEISPESESEILKLQREIQELVTGIVEKAIFVNPPGILFHGKIGNYFGLKTQSLALEEGLLVSEKYFINMISQYLLDRFELYTINIEHNEWFSYEHRYDETVPRCKLMYSSYADEMVLPFFYVAMFAGELKYYEIGNETQISNFVYKIMQHHNLHENKIEEVFDEYFSNDKENKKNQIVEIAKKYLEFRDDYFGLQLEYQESSKPNKEKWGDFSDKAKELLYKMNSRAPTQKIQVKKLVPSEATNSPGLSGRSDTRVYSI